MRIGHYETHPAADAFPLMTAAAFDGLMDDIKAGGLKHRPVLFGGRILDGRNRVMALLELDMPVEFETFEGDEDEAIRYVVSVNLTRRDLDAGQRALAAKRLVTLHVEHARKARKASKAQPALPSVRLATDEQAEQLLADGTPELVAAVDRGDIPLSHAAEVSRLEPEQQREVVERLAGPEVVKPQRAKASAVPMMSMAVELSPVDVAAVQCAVRVIEKSAHAEVRAAAAVMRRVMPMVGR